MGSAALYEALHDNPNLECYPADYVNNPHIIGINDRVVSINAMIDVDLSGHWARSCPRPSRSRWVQRRWAARWPNSAGLAKKPFRAAEPARPEVQRQRAAGQETVQPHAPEDLVVLDAAGCHQALTRLYARAPRGQRAQATKPVNRGRQVTRLGGLRLQGLVAAMTIEGCTDGEGLLAFVRQVLVPQLRPGQILLMENLTAPKVAGVADACVAAGVRRLYLPPYAPDLSPIDAWWSKVKTRLRATASRMLEALEQAITEALAAITR
jgi:transposase